MPQYQRAVTLALPEATADSRVLTRWTLQILKRIYRPGYGYHKAGITLMEIVPRASQQLGLFVPTDETEGRDDRLMHTLDAINARYGRGSLRLAVEGMEKPWLMRRERLSPRYTTEWAGLVKVGAGTHA